MASTPDGSDPDLALSLYVAIGRIVRTMRQDAPNARVGPGGLGVLVALDQAGPLLLKRGTDFGQRVAVADARQLEQCCLHSQLAWPHA